MITSTQRCIFNLPSAALSICRSHSTPIIAVGFQFSSTALNHGLGKEGQKLHSRERFPIAPIDLLLGRLQKILKIYGGIAATESFRQTPALHCFDGKPGGNRLSVCQDFSLGDSSFFPDRFFACSMAIFRSA